MLNFLYFNLGGNVNYDLLYSEWLNLLCKLNI
jgi:hypothetical protein